MNIKHTSEIKAANGIVMSVSPSKGAQADSHKCPAVPLATITHIAHSKGRTVEPPFPSAPPPSLKERERMAWRKKIDEAYWQARAEARILSKRSAGGFAFRKTCLSGRQEGTAE